MSVPASLDVAAAVKSMNLQEVKLFAQTLSDGRLIQQALDQELRLGMTSLIKESAPLGTLTDFVDFCVSVTDAGYASRNLPIVLLSDIFDTSCIDRCEIVFEYVEAKASLWSSPFYFDLCRNHVLRMCNDLLRRLSRSIDTLFSGRILIFLARFLPLMEKSGLNLMSNFNVENITTFDTTEYQGERLPSPVAKDSGDEEMEEGEMTEAGGSDVVDFALYRKFWEMQEFFSQPNNCYGSWKKFRKHSDDVLSVLSSWKLEPPSATPGTPSKKRRLDSMTASEPEAYFAKYLTSQKLLQLQLNDSNFRRCVLIQFLIAFQYLLSDVRFKEKKLPSLSEEQSAWIGVNNSKIYRLLEETYPNGKEFSNAVRTILRREKHWSDWKNEGCPDYPKRIDVDPMGRFNRRKRIADFSRDVVDVGNPGLTKLWNVGENFEVCKDKKRQFTPSLKQFVEEDGLQIPSDGASVTTELEQKYQWRALRLLADQGQNFFTNLQSSNVQWLDMSSFLRDQLRKFLPPSDNSSNNNIHPSESSEAQQGVLSQPLSNAPSTKDEEEEMEDGGIDEETLETLSKLMAPDFQALQSYLMSLSVLGDDYEKQEGDDNGEVACLTLLQHWKSKTASTQFAATLATTLQAAELFNEDIATVLQGIRPTESVV